jgi:hypothetical protein
MTQDQFNQFARQSGATLKSDVLANLPEIQNATPAAARKLVERSATVADGQTAIQMGLVSPSAVPKRASGHNVTGGAVARLPRPAGQRSSLISVHRHSLGIPKLHHIGVHAPKVHTLSSLRPRHHRLAF